MRVSSREKSELAERHSQQDSWRSDLGKRDCAAEDIEGRRQELPMAAPIAIRV